MSARLVTPERAIRMKPRFEHPNPSVWHFQSNTNKAKTQCGLIIPKNPHNRWNTSWEVSDLAKIKTTKAFCATCLGVIGVEETRLQAEMLL